MPSAFLLFDEGAKRKYTMAHYADVADDPTPPPDDPDVIIDLLEEIEDHYLHPAAARARYRPISPGDWA